MCKLGLDVYTVLIYKPKYYVGKLNGRRPTLYTGLRL